MRRTVVIALLAAAALAVAAPASLAASWASARLSTCATAPAQADRYAVFKGTMKSLRAGNRMSMRFQLYRREPGAAEFSRVAAPELGVWRRANKGVPSYTFRQRVEGLPAPAYYRAEITFKWKGPKGRSTVVVEHATKACKQPDLRADLRVAFLAVQAIDETQADYTVLVRNPGGETAGDAGGFDVVLQVAGVDQVPILLAALGPGDTRVVTLRGPRCVLGSTFQASLDPDDRVAESNEANNTAVRTCLARRRG